MAHPVEMNPVLRNAAAGAAAAGTSAPIGGQRDGPSAPAAAGNPRHDRVELSEQARLLEKMSQTLQSTPDAREAVVAAMRAKLDSGTYHVDATRLATRLAQTLTPAVAAADQPPESDSATTGPAPAGESQA